ncbi:RDD family protein [Niveispirillum sp. KHB5.9]|uniref:RDD family protein n=1 Tax=Niveispirillum sp. KHB5.9 TaxID=3400269 RepID=UPI003A86BFDA
MPDRWWYAYDGECYGPLTAERVGKLLMARELDGRDWMWRPGMAAWAPIGTLPDFAPALREAGNSLNGQKPEPVPPPDRFPDTEGARRAGPWSRYLATILDLSLVNITLLLSLMLMGYWGKNLQIALSLNICVLPITLLLLGISVAATGTTPGKALLGLRLRQLDGRRPDIATLAQRQIQLWVQGFALGIPIIGLFFMYFAKKRVDRAWRTKWDGACGLDVYQDRHDTARFSLVLLAGLAINLGLQLLITGRIQISFRL